MAPKSLGRLVSRSRNCAHERSFRALSHRCAFSSSATFQRSAIVPSFTETSSPELNEILSNIRSNVFLPACLSEKTARLIRNREKEASLRDEPMIVHIGEEAFRLAYVDPFKTTGFRRSLKAALHFMKPKDWDILVPFLTGWKLAGRSLDSKWTLHWKHRTVQKAGSARRLDVIIDCARKVDSTGFTLDDPHLLIDLVSFAPLHAAQERWEPGFTAKQLSRVEEIVYLLEDERHSGGYKIKEHDPRTRPEIIGILLQLSAVLAVKKHGGKDVDGKVKKYAERLRAVIEQGEGILDSAAVESFNVKSQWGEDHYYLVGYAPVVHGMKVAQEVLEQGSALWYWTKAQETMLGEAIDSAYERLNPRVQEFFNSQLFVQEGEEGEAEDVGKERFKEKKIPRSIALYDLLFDRSTA